MLDYRIMYKEYNRFKDFAFQAFYYLNGKINPDNICVVKLDYYDKHNFAEYRKPNLIAVKLATIVDQLYHEPDEVKKGLILLCIAHELVHANQSGSMMRYSADEMYAKAIESHAERTAQDYLKAHKEEIKELFGIDIQLGISYYGEVKPIDFDIPFDRESYYVNTLIDMFMGNRMEHESKLRKVFAVPNIYITFDNKTVAVKENGLYLDSGVRDFNNALIAYRRGNMNLRIISTFHVVPTYRDTEIIEAELVYDINKILYFPLMVSE